MIFTNAPQAPLHNAVLMEEVSFPFPHTYHPYRLAPGFFSFGTNCTHGIIQLPLRYPRLYNDKDSLAFPNVFPRNRGSDGYGGSPRGRSKEVRVGGQRLFDHLLESVLLVLGLLHPLLGHLLKGLLLLLGLLHPLLGGLLEGLLGSLLPLLRLLGQGKGRNIEKLHIGVHRLLHYLLEGLLLTLDLISRRLHCGYPSLSNLLGCLLSAVYVIAHFLFSFLVRHLRHNTPISPPRDNFETMG